MRRLLAELTERFRALFRRSHEDAELAEEMAFHLEMETEAGLRAGLSAKEARRQARLKFGSVDRYREETRDARGVAWLDRLRQDLRFGWRGLRRRPGFALLAMLTLGVGIGAATAVFSLADAILFEPVPGAPHQDRYVQVRLRAPSLDNRETGISYPNLADLRSADLPAVADLVAWQGMSPQVAVPGRSTEVVRGAAVYGDLFAGLGVRALEGRLFTAAETALDDPSPVVVLSGTGRARLFGEDTAVGQSLVINGEPFTVVGVAADGFRGTDRTDPQDLWIPFGMYPRIRHMDVSYFTERNPSMFRDVLARLAPGATPAAAEAQLRLGLERLVSAMPEQNERYAPYRPVVLEDIRFSPYARNGVRWAVWLMLAAVGLVLLVACSNVANLLIFRGIRRQGETAVRRATGATFGRIVRQHLTESAMLAAGGVVVGVALAWWTLQLLPATGALALPTARAPGLDLSTLAFSAAAGAATVLLAGLLPALLVSRLDVSASLKGAGRTDTGRKWRLRTALTVGQVALSLTLLVGAALLGRTVSNLYDVPLGFDASAVAVRLDPEPQGYDEAAIRRFERDLLAAAGAIPGVREAAIATQGPLRTHYLADVRAGDDPGPGWRAEARQDQVSGSYFAALGIPVVEGRTFSPEEEERAWTGDSDVAVINETLARRLFDDGRAAGRTILERGYREDRLYQVVGVVAESRAASDLRGPTPPQLFRPLGDRVARGITLILSSDRPPSDIVAATRGVVDLLDPAIPFHSAGPLADVVADLTGRERLLARLLAGLAGIAGSLAGVGLYGVVAFSVAERRRELGIRVAMGARTADVVGLVVRQALTLAAAGIGVGLLLSWGLGQALSSMLFGVAPVDPATWALAAAAFAALAIVAAAAPARAASAVDPVATLKAD